MKTAFGIFFLAASIIAFAYFLYNDAGIIWYIFPVLIGFAALSILISKNENKGE